MIWMLLMYAVQVILSGFIEQILIMLFQNVWKREWQNAHLWVHGCWWMLLRCWEVSTCTCRSLWPTPSVPGGATSSCRYPSRSQRSRHLEANRSRSPETKRFIEWHRIWILPPDCNVALNIKTEITLYQRGGLLAHFSFPFWLHIMIGQLIVCSKKNVPKLIGGWLVPKLIGSGPMFWLFSCYLIG